MTSKLPGTIISLKLRLEDKLIDSLPEPLRSEASGFRAGALGLMKEIAGFGIEMLSYLNGSIDVSTAASEHGTEKNVKPRLKKIELD